MSCLGPLQAAMAIRTLSISFCATSCSIYPGLPLTVVLSLQVIHNDNNTILIEVLAETFDVVVRHIKYTVIKQI